MREFKHTSYLLGCYLTVADYEINALELEALGNFIQPDKDSELYLERKKIFADDKTKIPFTTLTNELRLSNYSESQKNELMQLLANIAYSDGYLSSQEHKMIQTISSIINVDSTPFLNQAKSIKEELIEKQKLKWHESIWGKIENFAYHINSKGKSDHLLDRFLNGLGFVNIIEEITEEALVDLERVSHIQANLDLNLRKGKKLIDECASLNQSKDKDAQQIIDIVNKIGANFANIISSSISENKEMLEKKKRNIRYFTIAFMGRTKAGKSTLHKVVTMQDDDDIGIGQLRTTRYNRSWYWERLRIVDTPGIGAPGGETDANIAKSIIDEADMICYIVTSDSIQETEFDFFETIKERNKPLYIILNYKSNLSEGIRLKKFLKNPTEWKDCKGAKSIEGHFIRIRERLEGKYNMNAVQIIPLHLLAAQLYVENKYEGEDSKKLLEGSNIQSFIRAVKQEIYETGCLKKSLSIIDGISFQTHIIYQRILNDKQRLHDILSKLTSKRKKLKTLIDNESRILLDDVDNLFDVAIVKLKNRANIFAESEYDNENASNKWSQDATVKSIITQTGQLLKSRVNDYTEKISSEIEEIATDLSFSLQMSEGTFKGEGIVNTRFGARVVTSILSTAGLFIISNLWHPGGWIMGGLALAFGAISNFITKLFTSKEEKKRKAIEKMKTELYQYIDKSMQSKKEETHTSLSKSVNKNYKTIESLFDAYINGGNKILTNLSGILTDCHANEDVINSLEGFRILDYLGKSVLKDKKIREISDKELRTNYPIERNWETHTITFKYKTNCKEEDKIKAEQATQMNIKF